MVVGGCKFYIQSMQHLFCTNVKPVEGKRRLLLWRVFMSWIWELSKNNFLLVATKRSKEQMYWDGRVSIWSIRSWLNNGRHVITPIGIRHNSYYSFLNFENANTVMAVTPTSLQEGSVCHYTCHNTKNKVRSDIGLTLYKLSQGQEYKNKHTTKRNISIILNTFLYTISLCYSCVCTCL